jgi:hypothetical protein
VVSPQKRLAAIRPACLLFLNGAISAGVHMSLRNVVIISCAMLSIAGCTTIATSTNTLTDDKIKSETSGALGLAPNELTIVNRRTEGVNTYVQLKANSGQEFSCIINGGNALSFGMVNPPLCSKKGEPIKTSPFSK